MNNNYKLEKEYKIPFETFRKAYYAFQKKNVMPKSYLFMALFLAIAVVYIVAAVKDPSSTLAYVLICVCIALGAREWYNPRKIRRNILEAFQEEQLQEVTYKLAVSDAWLEISTIAPEEEEETSQAEEDIESEDYEDYGYDLPEPTRIDVDDDLYIYEYEEFFLIYKKKQMFYIVPKDGFTENELEVMRSIR